MRQFFVDSYYYIALINPYDTCHDLAIDFASTASSCHFWTTDLVLIEVANALSSPRSRLYAAEYLTILGRAPDTTIISLTSDLFNKALELYEQRPDKDWSLTDCFSFIVMENNRITDALTGDNDFRQAGFTTIF